VQVERYFFRAGITKRTVPLRTATAARVAPTHWTPKVGVHVSVPAATFALACRKTICRLAVCLIRSVPRKLVPYIASVTDGARPAAVLPR